MLLTLTLAGVLQLADTVYHGRAGDTRIMMPPAVSGELEREVRIDGALDEAAWTRAPLLTGFSLYNPTDGRPAPDSTEVRVWYSPTALYIGVRAFEPHGAVRATLADRDRVSSDDNVEIHLDTFEERRRAFVFIVNPLGVQADGTKAEGGGFIPGANVSPGQTDLSADFQWQSRGRTHEWGWEAELRIPFSSLRFPSRSRQTWGVQIIRKVQHSGYEQTWTPARRASASFIAQEGWLVGMTGLQHGVDLTLNPELTSTTSGGRTSSTDPSWAYRTTPRLGGNVRAGLGSNFVLNGTVRPDFSQVEADALQVAADQRFALFYPERRPFFVEGSDQFNVPNTLVYTRRIVQPDAALKLTGRMGRTNLSLLSALDAPPSGVGRGFRDKPLVDVLRVTRDFAEQSQAGFVYSDRVRRGMSNRMAGADVRHVFGGLYYATLQYAASRTTVGSGATAATRGGALWEAVVDRTGRGYGFHYNLLAIQPDFRADNGFVARTGFVQPNFANRVTFFGKPGARFERFQAFGSVSGIWRYADFWRRRSLLESRANISNTLTFRGGWSVSANPAMATYAFDPASYGSLFSPTVDGVARFTPSERITTGAFTASVSTPQYRRFAASAGTTFANDVDFLETSRIRRQNVTASLDLRPTPKVRVNATYNSQTFTRRLDGLPSYSTHVPRVKMEYQVSRPVFVRLVSQFEGTRREALRDPRTGGVLVTRRPDGTFAVGTRTSNDLLRTDALFSYRPRPGTVFFAGYGVSVRDPDGDDATFPMARETDGIFVKASWLWRGAK